MLAKIISDETKQMIESQSRKLIQACKQLNKSTSFAIIVRSSFARQSIEVN